MEELKRECAFCKKIFIGGYKHKKSCTKYCAQRLAKIRVKFNITGHDIIDILEKQKNKCCICKGFVSYHDEGIKASHIDHCHTSGKVRGILCSACNLGLGHFKDNKTALRRAINYLIKSKKEEE